MSCIRFVLLGLLLVSCASKQMAKREVIVPKGEPVWLYSAQEFCAEKSLCASAEGSTFAESDARAKKSLASIFEMRVQGSFRFTKHSFSGDEQSAMQEFVQDEVANQVDLVLKGAKIGERFKKDGLMFSLAMLDKQEAKALLLKEISETDNKIQHFYRLKNKLYVKKLNLLFNKREILNEKLIIVDGNGLSRKVNFDQINNLKFVSGGGSRLSLKVGNNVPESLEKKLEETFTGVGYKLTKKKDQDFLINVDFKEKEEYLNVSGFKKYTFEMNLFAKNNKGKKVGSYIVSLVSNGRDKDDAFLKIKRKFITELESNIDKLNLK